MQEAISWVVEAVLVLDVHGVHDLGKLVGIELKSEVDGVTGEVLGTEADLAEVHLDDSNVLSKLVGASTDDTGGRVDYMSNDTVLLGCPVRQGKALELNESLLGHLCF